MPLYKKTRYCYDVKFIRANIKRSIRCCYCRRIGHCSNTTGNSCRYLNNVMLCSGLNISYIPYKLAYKKVKNF